MLISSLENGELIFREAGEACFELACELLVVGAGTAGSFVADSARREGIDVILLEISSAVGGMHSVGGVTGYYYGGKGGSYESDDKKSLSDKVFLKNRLQPEQRQIRVFERLSESGVKILTRHNVTGLFFDGDLVVGARVFNGEKSLNIKAALTVDATSDGHLVRLTSVAKRYGTRNDHRFVPYTVRVEYLSGGELKGYNGDHGRMDHYRREDFTLGTLRAHSAARATLGLGEFVALSPLVGIREGLGFEGEQTLRYEDILLERLPERILFYAYSDLDRHGFERASDEELFLSFFVISNLSTATLNIPVPMGAVIPKGVGGLITAGRCISADSYAMSAVRMNRDMLRMGECIGVAAAMAIRNGVSINEIDYEEYRSRVEERGCFNGYPDRRIGFDNSYTWLRNKARSLGRPYEHLPERGSLYEPLSFDIDLLFDKLKTDAPGAAIWSCYLRRDDGSLEERLAKELSETSDELYRINLVIALGIMGKRRVLGALREALEGRDCFFFTDNRRTNQFRSAILVCLLGRLGDRSDLDTLRELLTEEEYKKSFYHELSPNYLYHTTDSRSFVYYSVVTHAIIALINIAKREGLDMREIRGELEELFGDDSFRYRLTKMEKGTPEYDELMEFYRYALSIAK